VKIIVAAIISCGTKRQISTFVWALTDRLPLKNQGLLCNISYKFRLWTSSKI